MDDMAAYYPPPAGYHPPPPPQYAYYPPPPPGTAQPPPPAVTHHLPQPYQPFPSYAAPTYAQSASYEEVRTLFIAGLPEDVKPREIYNLFREFPGYESSHLRNPTEKNQPFGFAVFMDQQSAIAALHTLNGMIFDLEKGSTLHIDLAKSNSRSKRSRDDDRHGSEKRSKGTSAFSRGISDPGVGSVHLPGIGNSAYNMIGYPPTQSHGYIDGNTAMAANSRNSSAPPCATLFVANLGPACTEQELNQVFLRCRGFLKLKIQSTYGSPVAFVDFQVKPIVMTIGRLMKIIHNWRPRKDESLLLTKCYLDYPQELYKGADSGILANMKSRGSIDLAKGDTASSSEALIQLQGTVLYSSTTGEGMRLEYAKSRMGMRSKKSRY